MARGADCILIAARAHQWQSTLSHRDADPSLPVPLKGIFVWSLGSARPSGPYFLPLLLDRFRLMEGSLPRILHRNRSSAPHRALISSFANPRQFPSFRLVDTWSTLLGTKKKPTTCGDYHNYYHRKRSVSDCRRLWEQLYFHIFLLRGLNCSSLFAFFFFFLSLCWYQRII